MEALITQLKNLKKQIHIQLTLLDIIGQRTGTDNAPEVLNIMNKLTLARSWIGKALSYIRGTAKNYNALREHVADRADLQEEPEGNIDELILEYQSSVEDLIQDLSTAYQNPGVADLDDNALMSLEYAWQHLNEADFHLAYLLDYRITIQQQKHQNREVEA